MSELLDFYNMAQLEVIQQGFADEIEWCRRRRLEDVTAKEFAFQYTFAVLSSSGLRNQTVQKIESRFYEAYKNGENPFDVVKNQRQRAALVQGWAHYHEMFEKFKAQPNYYEMINYLETLPQIGPKEKYHLARNLGIDCVKPDRHMERLAETLGFKSPDEMCLEIQRQIPGGERLGVIDVILWRYCNLIGGLA